MYVVIPPQLGSKGPSLWTTVPFAHQPRHHTSNGLRTSSTHTYLDDELAQGAVPALHTVCRAAPALRSVALSVYLANTVLIAWLCPGDEAALLDYSTKVPRLFHTTTATAFFTAFGEPRGHTKAVACTRAARARAALQAQHNTALPASQFARTLQALHRQGSTSPSAPQHMYLCCAPLPPCAVLNLTSFIFEDSVAKRQLALLSCTIKAAACYTALLTASQPNVFYDRHGLL